MANKPKRWTREEMLHLAAKGVTKVDLLGSRGTTLCSMDEIEAMAAVLALSGLLFSVNCAQSPASSALPGNAREIPGGVPSVNETPIFKTRRKAP